MLSWIGTWVLVILGFAATLANAATPSPGSFAAQLYPIRRWTTENGLPQNRVSCLQQSRDGYLWIGTWAGLVRFDGWRFTVFDKYNTPDLPDDSINALAEDSDGTLWIGTSDGLVSYSARQFRRWALPEGMAGKRIWHLLAPKSGGLWVQGGSYVAQWVDGTFSKPSALPGFVVQRMVERGDTGVDIILDRCWLTLAKGGGPLQQNELHREKEAVWPIAYLEQKTGSFWVGKAPALVRLHEGVWKDEPLGGPGPVSVNFIEEDRAGRLWVDTIEQGLFCRDATGWVHVDLGLGRPMPRVVCLLQDRDDAIWVGTEAGLLQLHQRSLRTFNTRDGLASDQVWSICETVDGAIWLGTGNGLSCIRSNQVVGLNGPEPLSNVLDRAVLPRREGGVWVGKSGYGLIGYREEFFDEFGVRQLPDSTISALYSDARNRLWIGTPNGVAMAEGHAVLTRYTNWCGRSAYDVRCILQSHDGSFWFGTQGLGLTRLTGDTFRVFRVADGLTSDRVWCLYEDAQNTLWIGTENGLTRYANGRFFPFRQKDGLVENAVNCILEDDFAYLWLSGLRGIYRVKRKQLDSFAEANGGPLACGAFGTADGMESGETNGEGQPSGWKARDGRLWFPTTRGAVVIDPNDIDRTERPPPVIIEEIVADSHKILGDWMPADATTPNAGPSPSSARAPASAAASAPELYLSPGAAKVLEFHYTATHFSGAERVRFAYRLDPHDSGWQNDDQNRRVAFYTDLAPGHYRFRVKACNDHGVWNEDGREIAFFVAPFFHQTWMFYTGCSVALIGLAVGGHLYRVGSLNRFRQLERQHALEIERARIARDIHDDLGSRFSQIAVLEELAERQLSEPERARPHLEKLRTATRDAFQALDEIVWAVNPKQDSLEGLVSYLREYVPEFLVPAGVQCHLEFPDAIPKRLLGAQTRHQVFLVIKEALQNVVKHARATACTLRLEVNAADLKFELKDNGRGFDVTTMRSGAGPGRSTPALGNGLRNMQHRMTDIGGTLQIESSLGDGTCVIVRLP